MTAPVRSVADPDDAFPQGNPYYFTSPKHPSLPPTNHTLKAQDDRTAHLTGCSATCPLSMDSKGRALDNIFVERLWRSVKYEEIYLHDYESVQQARDGINHYFDYYNNERQHQSLAYLTPA